ncbi:MAG: hypothetical protein K2W95_32540 [Candidatus Obscuribacterales bacterium]|nr:hypothetical protein [Candidatus Obscuribacterales bacterium]
MEPQDSPAKLFLAAVSKASRELEVAIAQTYEEALKLNVQLTDSAKVHIEQSDASVEEELRASVNSLQEERQQILDELVELRKQELQTLSEAGARVREYLTVKLEELVLTFEQKIQEGVTRYQEQLAGVEAKLAQDITGHSKQLSTAKTTFANEVAAEIGRSKQLLDEFQTQQQQILLTQTENSVSELKSLTKTIEVSLRDEARKIIERMSETLQTQMQSTAPSARISTLSQNALTEDKVTSSIAADLASMRALPEAFEETSSTVAKMQTEVHAKAIKNASVRCARELQNAVDQVEEQLSLIGEETKLTLHQFEETYIERFIQKLEDFERTAQKEVLEGLAEHEKAGLKVTASKDKELKELFLNLRKSTAGSVRACLADTEKSFEADFEEFKNLLAKQREEKTHNLEKECKAATEQLEEIFKTFDKESTDVERQLSELEAAASELDEFVSALSHADLDF